MQSIGEVSEHLKNCPYNVRSDHKQARTKNHSWDTIFKKIAMFDVYQGLKRVYD